MYKTAVGNNILVVVVVNGGGAPNADDMIIETIGWTHTWTLTFGCIMENPWIQQIVKL